MDLAYISAWLGKGERVLLLEGPGAGPILWVLMGGMVLFWWLDLSNGKDVE